jgi:hypothetical protein
MTWPPHYTKEVLETGDEYAAHVCGKGGLSMGAPIIGTGETREDGSCGVTDLFQVAAPAVPAPMPVEEPGEVPLTPELAPWLRYINNLAGTYFWLSND